mgnify:CR=1 FL=1
MNDEPTRQLILFQLNKKPFGIDATTVQEILPQTAVRQVPRLAEHIEGIFSFRGRIIPLINLGVLLSLTDETYIGNIIVISQRGQLMGLIVDKVLAVLTDHDQFEKIKLDKSIPNTYVQDFVAYKELKVAVLDLAKIATTIAAGEE